MGSASLVIANAAVYTVDPQKPWATAVAVEGDRIIYVGDDAGVRAYVGPETRVIDAQRKMVLPGFIESHWHLSTTALFDGPDISSLDPTEVLESVKAYAEANPSAPLIMSMGWVDPVFPPELVRRETLDALVPDRPVVLICSDHHIAWLNSAALELAGITADTPGQLSDVSWIEKDELTGEPTGRLVDGEALLPVFSALEEHKLLAEPVTRYTRSIRSWLPKLTAAGITTIFDAGFLEPSGNQEVLFTALRNIAEQDGLPIRVATAYMVPVPEHMDDVVSEIKRLRTEYSTDLVTPGWMKLFVDGIETASSAYLLEDYADRPGHRGGTVFTLEELARCIAVADLEGIDVMLHCCGDAAVRHALDALEIVTRDNPPRDRRHTITHAFLTDPLDVPRFRQLGVIANTQLQWGISDPYNDVIRQRYGDERWSRMYTFASFIDQGVTVSLGMDALACACRRQHRPVEALESAMTRRTVGEPDAPALPGVPLALPELIAGYTINGAYQLGMEDEIGSLVVGKKADLIILEKNLFDLPESQIGELDVVLTVMNGQVTHATVPKR